MILSFDEKFHGVCLSALLFLIGITNVNAATPQLVVGSYNTISNSFPWVAQSTDDLVWSYTISSSAFLPFDYYSNGQFNGATCSGPVCIAGGSYSNLTTGHANDPLIAVSTDNGMTWTYPPSVITNLPADFSSLHGLNGVSCNDNLCIAAGIYNSNAPPISKPYLAVSTDSGGTWNYPTTVFSNVPSDFDGGGFTQQSKGFPFPTLNNSASCNDARCVAVGQYQSAQGIKPYLPMLAISRRSGTVWTYFHRVPGDFDFDEGIQSDNFFNGICCQAKSCVAVGGYDATNPQANALPLLAVSHDHGLSWSYPPSVTSLQNLPADYSQNQHGLNTGFFSVSCDGALCAAAGQYSQGHTAPLLAVSHNDGDTWDYPHINFPPDYQAAGFSFFNSVSCRRDLCVAAGFYLNRSATFLPLLVVSTDQGITWNSPPDITDPNKLPPDFFSGISFGFSSVNCGDTACVAVGNYGYSSKGKGLVAVSTNGGINWSYPSTIYTIGNNLPTDWVNNGTFNAVGTKK